MSETGVRGRVDHWAEYCHGDGLDGYGNRCVGYANSQWPCNKCCAQNGLHNSAGFMETNELLNTKNDNFPLTLVAHRGEKTIPVLNVRADSIEAKESIFAGYVDLLFEVYGTDVTGTIPMVDYWTTESQ